MHKFVLTFWKHSVNSQWVHLCVFKRDKTLLFLNIPATRNIDQSIIDQNGREGKAIRFLLYEL
jgi:hypothetical protein